MIPIYVGYDPRESVAPYVFQHSVLSRTKAKCSFTYLCGDQEDASNTFSKERFRIPELQGHHGWAIWADGDMLCRADIQELWDLRRSGYDVMVVKHEYRTKHKTKYLDAPNEDYPRKNWSSLMLIDCGNMIWRRPEYKALLNGQAGHLHRFDALDDERIGDLPKEWNWLSVEMPYNPDAKIVHHTLGTPCWQPYATIDPYANEWREELKRVNYFQPWEPSPQVLEETASVAGGVLGVSGR